MSLNTPCDRCTTAEATVTHTPDASYCQDCYAGVIEEEGLANCSECGRQGVTANGWCQACLDE